MTVHHVKGARLYFDGKLVGDASLPKVSDRRPDTEGFSTSGKMTGTFTLDIESQAALRAWALHPYQKEAIERLMALPSQRTAPFEFGGAHYNRMVFGTENDRRFMVVDPSARSRKGVYGKAAPRWKLYTASTPGKTTSAHVLSHFLDTQLGEPYDDAVFPRPPNTVMAAVVKRICANWGKHNG